MDTAEGGAIGKMYFALVVLPSFSSITVVDYFI